MLLEPPTVVSQNEITLSVREIEPLFAGAADDVPPWPGATITLKDGRTMYIREATLEEAPAMMGYMKRVMEQEHDFYDVVGARVHAEIAGWYRKRLKDPYTLLGLVDGEWVGFANGRLMNEDINISLHTMALARGGRIGAIMYYVKTYYAFEILGNKEFWRRTRATTGGTVGGSDGAALLPLARVPARAGRARVYYVTKSTGMRSSRTTSVRWSAPTWCSRSQRTSSKRTSS